ncbi:hypothetical protein Acsp03_23530 [Actinomadura sp. NBRC 104412]|uniref:helix-turn-helix domain-containing protein n=1 Tax=Actinomadura sp. NBRC 104412 TaxID=3032203 RepID=UPI0024A1799D|nr:helix-turn-helix domain-containing protein [Actinomadura sp. NBRC 104412]GLZ04887.1 hypothetical protein Acsp03_23530 [Actinomadura sp. NBRC 104412]
MTKKLPEELRELAISLRREGKTYREIAGSLGVSISTCSLWLHDVPAPERPGYHQERVAAMWESRWAPFHRERERARLRAKVDASKEVADLSDREVLLAGALIYWCEGTKDKPYRRSELVDFINSDPAVITFFLRFLRVAGVPRERLRFRIHIHESADLGEAERYWAALAGIGVDEFQKPVLKRHNAKTTRKNLTEDYRGCLNIRVRKSADLYRRIEGYAYGAMLGSAAAGDRFRREAEHMLGRLEKERPVPSPGK